MFVSKEDAFRLVMSMYLGESCKYCDKTYKSLDDLNDTVYAGYHKKGRLACKKCWEKNNKKDNNG